MEVRVKLTPLSVYHIVCSFTALILFVVVAAYVVVHCIFFGSVLRCSFIAVVMAVYEISPFRKLHSVFTTFCVLDDCIICISVLH